MSNPIITLGEILNPEKYTGIVERDFHLYNKNRKDEPDYVHIEPDVKPKCTCIMYKNKYDKKNLDRCDHISYVIKDVLGLKEKENLRYTEEELKKAFEETESKNKKIIRETYGLVKRKNFKFPNPKVYKYEYDEDNDEDGYESHEWRIKERLYSRGVVAEEFHYSDNDYSNKENDYDEYFTSEKDAKPPFDIYKEPIFEGKQLKLHKKFIEKEEEEKEEDIEQEKEEEDIEEEEGDD